MTVSGWTVEPFTQCVKPLRAPAKVKRKDFLDQGEYPIISQESDFINGWWSREEDVLEVSDPLVIFGDHTTVLKFVDFDFVVGADGVKVLKPKPYLDPKYLYYFLMGHPLKELGYARHFRLLKELEVWFPPLSEQRRLVGLLDAAFAGLATATAHTQKNLQNARELFGRHLQHVFGSLAELAEHRVLSDVCKLRNGRTYKKNELLSDGKYPVLRVGNFFTNRQWYFSNLELEPERYCQQGDLLYAWSASFGPRIWEGEKSIFHYHIWRVDHSAAVDRQYLYYWFLWDAELVRAQYGAGSTMLHVSKKSMDQRRIPVPCREKQMRVVNQLNELRSAADRLADVATRKLAALEELKRSILQRAFRGELTGSGVDVATREAEAVS